MSKFELFLRFVVIGLVIGAISLLVLAAFADTGRAQERPTVAAPTKNARPPGAIPPGLTFRPEVFTETDNAADLEFAGTLR
jgi:hypothetical protein